jgi:hypothetical protein
MTASSYSHLAIRLLVGPVKMCCFEYALNESGVFRGSHVGVIQTQVEYVDAGEFGGFFGSCT